MVAGSRTLTQVKADPRDNVSVLIRLCAEHTDAPLDELTKLLDLNWFITAAVITHDDT